MHFELKNSSNLVFLKENGEKNNQISHEENNSSNTKSFQSSSSSHGRKTRSLIKIYKNTNEICEEKIVYFAFFVGEDPISYEYA